MEFTPEMIEKARTAADAAELIELAKAEGIELTAEKANEVFLKFHSSEALADDELDEVSGGCTDFDDGVKQGYHKVYRK